MRLRTAVLLVAGLGIPLALCVLVLPITWGYGGYNTTGDRVFYVDPTGPAAHAGLREGDGLEPLHGIASVEQFAGSVGTTVHFRVHRNGAVVPLDITFQPFPGSLAIQQRFNKTLQALTALGAFLLALLVLFRARNVQVGARAAAVLVASGTDALAVSFGLTAGNAVLAALCYDALPVLLTGASFWAMLALLTLYPQRRTRVQSFAGAAGPWLFAAFALLFIQRSYDIWSGRTGFFDTLFSLLVIVSGVIVSAAIVDAIANAPAELRTPTWWLGGCWIVAGALGAIGPLTTLLPFFPVLRSHYADVLSAAQTFFLSFGVAYAVLRYRLADLHILVTRATVFGMVSLIIVALFAACEWAIGRIFERSIGITDASGVGLQVATIILAVALGISTRPIHAFVDSRMTQVFFRKRLKALAEIKRVAGEADICTDAQALMDLACATVQRTLNPRDVACYLDGGAAYSLAACGDEEVAVRQYDFNAAIAVRLRRWQEPFEIDDESNERRRELFLPMTVRGRLIGFLSCGPKPDETAYLSDEIEALLLLAHHVGIGVAWLTPASAATSPRVAGSIGLLSRAQFKEIRRVHPPASS